MRLADFDFDLPPDRIAQHPARPRDAARLLHVTRDGVAIRPLRPVERFDEFHLMWRVDDDSKSVKQFIEIAMEAAKR